MQHPTRILVVTATIAAISMATLAEARPGHRGPMSIAEAEARFAAQIQSADVDGDGAVSEDEFAQMEFEPGPRRGHQRRMRHHGDHPRREPRSEHLPALFEALDEDGDGSLSSAEFATLPETGRALRRANQFRAFDSNGDGQITTDDEPPHITKLRTLDSDGDGVISRDEVRELIRARRQEAGEI